MATDYVRVEAEARKAAENLSAAAPEAVSAFFQLADATLKDGALDSRTKELMALGIAIAGGCEGCIVWHAKAAYRLGATRDQVAELIGVAVEMGGGPSLFDGSKALDAYDQFVAEAASTQD